MLQLSTLASQLDADVPLVVAVEPNQTSAASQAAILVILLLFLLAAILVAAVDYLVAVVVDYLVAEAWGGLAS